MKEHAHNVLDQLMRMKREKKRGKRLTNLLREAENEGGCGWDAYIPKCFNDALDIRLTERKNKGEVELAWTQGFNFSFKVGDILYFTQKPIRPWTEAIKYLDRCIQIMEANDATSTDEGTIKFHEYVPNKDRTGLLLDKKMENAITQDEFVRLLIGSVSNQSSKEPDLFDGTKID